MTPAQHDLMDSAKRANAALDKFMTQPSYTHTPGPWELGVSTTNLGVVEIRRHKRPPSSVALAYVFGNDNAHNGEHPISREEAIANALLMAAAPELLDALKECQRQCWVGHRERTKDLLLGKVTAAIAKAIGR